MNLTNNEQIPIVLAHTEVRDKAIFWVMQAAQPPASPKKSAFFP